MSLITCEPATVNILAEVAGERVRQDAKWGKQDHPSLIPDRIGIHAYDAEERAHHYGVPEESAAKDRCESRFKQGTGTYADIFVEEVAEAIGAKGEARLREELIQCAAVAVAWIECIDRRAGQGAQAQDVPA